MIKLNTPEAKIYLDNIRDYVDMVLKGNRRRNDTHEICRCIMDNLGRLTNGKIIFVVDVLEIGRRDKPFIMACYPDADELNSKCSKLIKCLSANNYSMFVDEWNSFHKWYIEIDYNIIDPKSLLCVETGSQFVAILCHELGHVMRTEPMKLVKNYYCRKAQFKIYERMFMEEGMSISKLFLPMFVAIDGLRVITSKPGSIVEEVKADFATPDEYKSHMVDYIDHKILTNPSTASGIVVTDQEYDAEQSKGIMFTKECIFFMKKRREVLNTYLSTMYTLTHSTYIKRLVEVISKHALGVNHGTGKVDNRRVMYMMEAYDRDEERISRKALATLESINVTERDIALLSIEVEGIETTDDKYYILNTIYDYMEAIENRYAKAIKKNKPMEASSLLEDKRYKALQDLRAKVLSIKVSNNQHYGVFIKYPKGYEG